MLRCSMPLRSPPDREMVPVEVSHTHRYRVAAAAFFPVSTPSAEDTRFAQGEFVNKAAPPRDPFLPPLPFILPQRYTRCPSQQTMPYDGWSSLVALVVAEASVVW